MSDPLKMTFDPMTIEHLGVRMYSTLPPVIGELISNSYDADASEVLVHLKDTEDKEITITDDGIGMSYEDINTKFLRIGRNRRAENDDHTTPKGRKVIGKKGLGKLSFFGITHEIEVSTVQNRKKTRFVMSWDQITNQASAGELSDYSPDILEDDIDTEESDGTVITLKRIQRASDFDPGGLANSLARIFICDKEFKLTVKHNDREVIEVTDERRFRTLSIQLEWDVPHDIGFDADYQNRDKISGKLLTTEKPISPRTNMRGITLFSRKKMVNAPEYFSDSASSHFYSYLTGWLEVDFIDDLDEDVIGTNRQSLNWNHPEVSELRRQLQLLIRKLEGEWRKQRAIKKQEVLSQKTGIDIKDWFSKVPKETGEDLSRLVEAVVNQSEMDDTDMHPAIMSIHRLIPEYPHYHWRHLHPAIREAAEDDYQRADYYRAFLEAAKRFTNNTRSKSGSPEVSEQSMMGSVYGADKTLKVTDGYKRQDGSDFNASTIRGIEDGQKLLAMGIVSGGRNPVSHEEVVELRTSGLFSEKDCLDGLSLLSHLQRRLDAAPTVSR